MFVSGLCSISDDRPSDLCDERRPKCKKGPLSNQKMKSLFFYYVQFLMIGQRIQAMNINQNVEKCLKNEMFIFGLCSISDD